MQYGFMQKAMWTAFGSSYRKALEKIFPKEDGAVVMKQAHRKYKEILSDVDEFSKDSQFLVNILSCAMVSAVLLSLKQKYDLETVRLYYKTAMDNRIMRFFATHGNSYTEKGRKQLKEYAKKSEGNTNPYDWVFSVEDGETINQYTAYFHTCGICYLMTKLGLKEYIPALCTFDYDMAEMNHTKFSREYTLADGGPYCDCHYNHGGTK